MLTAAQIRAARALLAWSQPTLAAASGLSLPTIVRMEGAQGPGRSSAANVAAVQGALESAGVVFIPADAAGGPGVRLKQA
ncbi:MAG: transcriptional regulator [Phenylobacterium sp.]|uniref:transcriptional regulator n=1 Tax=Phenylobacterium sp. TaxID=1871053 RepID=UPI001A1A80AE|nr:transcriptional regulator [Phenylobacterium sp.]MBJ7411259.1 transcriptional regulator [Phenylobacterium sp.]